VTDFVGPNPEPADSELTTQKFLEEMRQILKRLEERWGLMPNMGQTASEVCEYHLGGTLTNSTWGKWISGLDAIGGSGFGIDLDRLIDLVRKGGVELLASLPQPDSVVLHAFRLIYARHQSAAKESWAVFNESPNDWRSCRLTLCSSTQGDDQTLRLDIVLFSGDRTTIEGDVKSIANLASTVLQGLTALAATTPLPKSKRARLQELTEKLFATPEA
jgi:hypothetical protein